MKKKFNDNCLNLENNKKILLHVCCAPCLAAALDKLKHKDVTVFFYNPNIQPFEEWDHRKCEVEKLVDLARSGLLGEGFEKLSLIVPTQLVDNFYKAIQNYRFLGEGSERCLTCIKHRLYETYQFAKNNGFDYFATTLTASPHKDAKKINLIGNELNFNMYIPTDFKKNSGNLKSKEICESFKIYRQKYCGCVLDTVVTPFRIGNVKIPGRLVLAPMAGFSDVGFRYIAKKCGAALTFTEMVSAKALIYKNDKTLDLLRTTDIEFPRVVQLFGHDSEVICKAVKLDVLQKFDIINLNMGCPMPKIYKNGDGAALLEKPELVFDIIANLKKNTEKPITIKFRKIENIEKTIEFAQTCEKAGADALILHARTKSQLYSGSVDWDCLKLVADNVNIPVIASGDIKDIKQAEDCLKKYNIKAVMIGRAAIGNPGIFGRNIDPRDAILLQLKINCENFGERKALLDIKKHISYYFKCYNNANKIRQRLLDAQTLEEFKSILQNI